MDILEFAVDYSVLFDVLVVIVILSFFVERALAVLFESSLFIAWYHPEFAAQDKVDSTGSGADGAAVEPAPAADGGTPPAPVTPSSSGIKKPGKKKKGAKEALAIIVSVILAANLKFDAVSVVMKSTESSPELGYFITGLIIAGGSKGSIKLFNDILDFRSDAEKRRKEFSQKLNGQ